MERKVKIEASLCCANFRNLEYDLRQLERGRIDFLHVDIMDGKFAPNFALDFSIMKTVQSISDIPMECHLMIENPENYIEKTAKMGARYITIHTEATHHVQRALRQIRDLGVKSGIALNPATPIDNLNYILDDIDMITIMTVNPGFSGQELIPATLGKIEETKKMLDSKGYNHIEIQVDGNVSFKNIPGMVKHGATMLVCGTSSIFSMEYSITEAISIVKEIIKSIN